MFFSPSGPSILDTWFRWCIPPCTHSHRTAHALCRPCRALCLGPSEPAPVGCQLRSLSVDQGMSTDVNRPWTVLWRIAIGSSSSSSSKGHATRGHSTYSCAKQSVGNIRSCTGSPPPKKKKTLAACCGMSQLCGWLEKSDFPNSWPRVHTSLTSHPVHPIPVHTVPTRM